eukprot:CAMPEP_0119052566 /NCGR_PEP_ID=MMETSP1177-20130426/73824_1 /TAXON_ID=2985 /ORGANISM="Ochromonas sp, Strain CCMP1899" /LENGTH=277 /DNA_ID=CAMNT_0007032179 /DNA_START=1130 /DNA_END=1960 /DNA_ORIENTATION=-
MARLYLTQHGNRKFMDGYEAYKGVHSSFDENILSQKERAVSRGGSVSKSRISLTEVSLKKTGRILQSGTYSSYENKSHSRHGSFLHGLNSPNAPIHIDLSAPPPINQQIQPINEDESPIKRSSSNFSRSSFNLPTVRGLFSPKSSILPYPHIQNPDNSDPEYGKANIRHSSIFDKAPLRHSGIFDQALAPTASVPELIFRLGLQDNPPKLHIRNPDHDPDMKPYADIHTPNIRHILPDIHSSYPGNSPYSVPDLTVCKNVTRSVSQNISDVIHTEGW